MYYTINNNYFHSVKFSLFSGLFWSNSRHFTQMSDVDDSTSGINYVICLYDRIRFLVAKLL